MQLGLLDFSAARIGSSAIKKTYLGSALTWESSRTLDSISVAPFSGGNLPLAIVSANAQTGDTVKLVLVPQGETVPSDTQIDAAQNSAGGSPLDSFTVTWPASAESLAIATGLDQFCDLHAVINSSGNLSNIESALNFEVDTTNPLLTAVTGTQTGSTTADWGATSDEAAETIFAAVRLDSDPALSKSDIENGTGDAVATDTDATPTADANNGGSFTGLTSGLTYRVDAFQRDEFGGESAVATSAAFTTVSSGVTGLTSMTFINNAGANYTFTGGPRPIADTDAVLTVGEEILVWVMMHSADAAITDADLHNFNLGAPSASYETGGTTSASVFTWQETVTADMLDASAELTLTGTGGQYGTGIIRIDGTLTTVTPVGNEWQMAGAVVDPLTVDINTGNGWVVLFGVKDRIDLGAGSFTWTAGLSVMHAWTDNNYRHEIVTGTTTTATPATYDATHGSVTTNDPGALLGIAFS